MRKTTLAGVAYFLGVAIVILLTFAGISVPFGISHVLAGLLLAPALMVPLTFANKRLLAWRKARGRDIEDEERYEHDGFISLRPRD